MYLKSSKLKGIILKHKDSLDKDLEKLKACSYLEGVYIMLKHIVCMLILSTVVKVFKIKNLR